MGRLVVLLVPLMLFFAACAGDGAKELPLHSPVAPPEITVVPDGSVYMGPDEPIKTLKQAFAAMKGGDTLVIRDGIYTGPDNRIIWASGKGGAAHLPPAGSAGAYTVIRAEHEGMVSFDGQNTNDMFLVYEGNLQYTEFRGLKWINTNVTLYYADGGSDIHHLKFFRCGVHVATHAPAPTVSAWKIGAGRYLLFEECYAWGTARYGFMVQDIRYPTGAQYIILRRCVVRLDDVDAYDPSYPNGLPVGHFQIYSGDYVEIQNCIAIDTDVSKFVNWDYSEGAFSLRKRDSGSSQGYLRNINIRGSVALNILGWTGASLESGGSLQYYPALSLYQHDSAYANVVEHTVLWDVMKGVRQVDGSDPKASVVRNLTLKTGNDPNYPTLAYSGAKGIRFSGKPEGWTYRNNIIINDQDCAVRGVDSDYNAIYTPTAGSCDISPDFGGVAGVHDYTDDNGNEVGPYDGIPGNGIGALKYILRQEAGSDFSGTGENGANRGATVLKRYGVSGTVWGDPGYNTLTGEDLWPFPYEAQIRADMRAYSPARGPAGNRGFCADGQTLTNYIWGYLGNAVPPLALAATPGEGRVTLNWAKPADIALPTIKGFNVYLVDGAQYSMLGTVNGNTTYRATISRLDPSVPHVFAVTTVDVEKGESDYSDLARVGPSAQHSSTGGGSWTGPSVMWPALASFLAATPWWCYPCGGS